MTSSLLFFVWALAFVGVNAADDSLSDFSNDLATDLGPLLALFGEPMTKQYLSESTTYLDYFIFAMGPIGILTAIVSAIRVCGHSSLRAFVGRSQEGNGIIEAELCTSTSRDVCELFNRGGITRVLGRPKILELVYFPPSGNQTDSALENSGIHLLRDYLTNIRHGGSRQSWRRANGSFWDTLGPVALNPPNLSLNVGIVQQGGWKYVSVALVGFLLQSGVLVLAGVGVWVLDWNLSERDDSASRNYAPTMFIVGTTIMCSGLWACAALIGQTTVEKKYKRETGGQTGSSQLIWLQPSQVIGDQSFDPFAFLENPDEPLHTWTSSKKNVDERFERYTFLAVPAVLIGYIMHFIGLRGMKAWVSLAQLGTTVVMSLLRGLLRMQRLGKNDNELADKPEMVVGYELDWLALKLINTVSTSTPKKRYYRQLLSFRVRLAHLTGHFSRFDNMADEEYQRWADSYVDVREKAKSVAAALCAAAEILFHKDQPRNDVVFSIPAFVIPNPSPGDSNINIVIKAPDKSSVGGWTVDSSRIEAMLGLATWSLISDERVISKQESNFKVSFAKNINTWRIVSATNEEGPEATIQTEVHLWFGPNTVQPEKSKIRVDSNGSYSLHDIWDRHGIMDQQIPWKPLNAGTHANGITHHYPQRLCGWTLVTETLRALRKEGLADTSEPATRAKDDQVNIKVQLVVSEDSLLDICAEELFTALVVGLADGLQGMGLRNDFGDTLSVAVEENHIRLHSTVINKLVHCFEDFGLGTHSTALLCLVPALRTHLGAGNPQVMFSVLTKGATKYRQASDWSKAEIILDHLLSFMADVTRLSGSEVGQLTVRTFRAMGELYRRSLSQFPNGTNGARMTFGERGLDHMKQLLQKFGPTSREIAPIIETYRSIANDLADLAAEKIQFSDVTAWNGNKHPLVQATRDCNRRNALLQLCFLKVGDFPLAGSSESVYKSGFLAYALPLAARNGWEEVVSAILEMNADPNSRDDEGRTAMSYCKELGNDVCLEVLVANGASDEDAT